MFTNNQLYGNIFLIFKDIEGVTLDGTKKLDKKIIFIMKIRGVVEGLYLRF